MYWLIIVVLAWGQIFAKESGITIPRHLREGKCQERYFGIYQNTEFLTDRNYSSFTKKYEHSAIMATHGGCIYCCNHENLIRRVGLLLEERGVRLGRLEMVGSTGFLKEFSSVKRFPFLIFFKSGQPYFFRELMVERKILQFQDQIYRKNPYESVKNLSQLDQILESDSRNVLVIGIFYDQREMDEEIKEFKMAAEQLRERLDLRFLLLEGKKRDVKEVKSKYGSKFFDDVSLSSIVLRRVKDHYDIIDISDLFYSMQSLSSAIRSKALRIVDEFTLENHEFYTSSELPILVAVLDTIGDIEGSQRFLDLLEEVGRKYLNKIHLTWVEGNLNPEKKKMLGVKHEKYPALAFFRIDFELKIVYPEELNPTQENIQEFINDYLEKPISVVLEKYSNLRQKIKLQKVQKYLRGIQEVREPKKLEKQLMQKAFSIVLEYHLESISQQELHIFAHSYRRIQELGYQDFFQAITIEAPDNLKLPPTLSIFIRASKQMIPIRPRRWIPSELISELAQKSDSHELSSYLKAYGEHFWVMTYDLKKYYNLPLNERINELDFLFQTDLEPHNLL